jgi:hypothetical protein
VKHLVGYLAAMAGSSLGWMIGKPLGLGLAFFLSLVGAAVCMYGARRWWYHHME